MGQTRLTSITTVRTVAVPVTDHQRALDFYVGKLGLEKRLDVAFGAGQRWIEVAPAGSSTTLALAPAQGTAKAGSDTGIRLATEDAQADHDRLLASGVDADAEVMRLPGVPPMFSFRDPDGNRLYIVEQRERV